MTAAGEQGIAKVGRLKASRNSWRGATFPPSADNPSPSASIRVHSRFKLPYAEGVVPYSPGLRRSRRYPGCRPHRVPYPARGCAVHAHREGGSNTGGIRSGSIVRKKSPPRTAVHYPKNITFHLFDPSAQPPWGCQDPPHPPGVAPRWRNPGLHGRIPLGFPEG